MSLVHGSASMLVGCEHATSPCFDDCAAKKTGKIEVLRQAYSGCTKGKGQILSNLAFDSAGNYLLSHAVSRAVQSAQRGLTSVFGMGTGGTPAVRSPTSFRNCPNPSPSNRVRSRWNT